MNNRRQYYKAKELFDNYLETYAQEHLDSYYSHWSRPLAQILGETFKRLLSPLDAFESLFYGNYESYIDYYDLLDELEEITNSDIRRAMSKVKIN